MNGELSKATGVVWPLRKVFKIRAGIPVNIESSPVERKDLKKDEKKTKSILIFFQRPPSCSAPITIVLYFRRHTNFS